MPAKAEQAGDESMLSVRSNVRGNKIENEETDLARKPTAGVSQKRKKKMPSGDNGGPAVGGGMRPERAPTQYGPPTKIRDLKNKKAKELHVPNHIKHMLQRSVASPFSLSTLSFSSFSLFCRCISRIAFDSFGH